MSEIKIKLEDITKTYYGTEEPVRVLNGISMSIDKPEMVAVMGPSGSGKSTLMNIVGCLDKPDGGTYEFDGYDVRSMNRDELAYLRNRRIGFVFQHFNLLSRTTALENVCLPLSYAGIRGKKAEERAKEMLEVLGLADRMYHLPSQMSGGQQQRVAIARALINNPDLLLADEPTGALDTHTSQEIMGLLQQLNRERALAMVIVTHDPEVSRYCHRIIRLRDGVITGEELVS